MLARRHITCDTKYKRVDLLSSSIFREHKELELFSQELENEGILLLWENTVYIVCIAVLGFLVRKVDITFLVG